jgi:hypothetical protein
MRDYIRYNNNGQLTTTEKYKTWKREHKDPAPPPPPLWATKDIEPGRYSYSGGSGYAYVSIQDPTIVIKLQWKPYLGEFEVRADRSAPGQYVGSFYVARHARIDQKLWPKGPFDVFVEYLPATKSVKLSTTNGTEFFPGGLLELNKEP